MGQASLNEMENEAETQTKGFPFKDGTCRWIEASQHRDVWQKS